jgi:hypothetical protein
LPHSRIVPVFGHLFDHPVDQLIVKMLAEGFAQILPAAFAGGTLDEDKLARGDGVNVWRQQLVQLAEYIRRLDHVECPHPLGIVM